MITVFISEMKAWVETEKYRSITQLILFMAMISILTMLRPDICLLMFTFLMVRNGMRSGKQIWNKIKLTDWVVKLRLPVSKVLSGKITATLVIGFIHLVIILPLLIIMIPLWGITWLNMILVIGMILIWMINVSLLSLFGYKLVADDGENDLVSFVLAIFAIITIIVPQLRLINPFTQIWSFIDQGKLSWGILTVTLVLTFILFIGQVKYIKHEVKWINETENLGNFPGRQ